MPLIQIVETVYTKEAKRLDCIYALVCTARIAVIDIKTGISQLIHLSSSDCMEFFANFLQFLFATAYEHFG